MSICYHEGSGNFIFQQGYQLYYHSLKKRTVRTAVFWEKDPPQRGLFLFAGENVPSDGILYF